MAEVTRKLLIVEIPDPLEEDIGCYGDNFLDLGGPEVSVRELPTAEELGRVALMKWHTMSAKDAFDLEDFRAVGQAIRDALIKAKPGEKETK